jgi:hypothetical protein
MNFYFGKRQMILMMMMMTLRNKRKFSRGIPEFINSDEFN